MIAGTPPQAALSVAPSRVVMAASEHREIRITNPGTRTVVVDAAPAGFSLSLLGRTRILPRGAPVVIEPRRVAVAPHGSARLTVSSGLPGGAAPGDHPGLVLLTTRAAPGGVAVRLRIGVVVLVRAAGAVVHRVVPQALTVRGGSLVLALRNGGNVAEQVDVRVALQQRGRVVARIGGSRRTLLPHSAGACALRAPTRLRGPFVASVAISVGGSILRRTFRIRR